MRPRQNYLRFLLLAVLAASLFPVTRGPRTGDVLAAPPYGGATAYDLIIAMNSLRASYGLAQLKEDAIVNAVAQGTAEIMAANQMSSHIGDVRGRLAAAGYGGGATVWATENFAVGTDLSIDEIMQMWSDSAHMIPAVNPAYCSVGAGMAQSSNGRTYYILQAAYTASKSCGEYKSVAGDSSSGGTQENRASTISQIIIPVKIATPDIDGKLYHVVQAGQSFWAIAVAYKITIKDIEVWNNISRTSTLRVGQKLFIPTSNTVGYSTPTPVGMIVTSTPDADGKIVHTVGAYQTLTTISEAYKTTIETLLQRNGIQADWPLMIGQKLVIHPGNVTPSPTPRPLTPLEKLTPEADGKLYHTVGSGETLYWIANLYGVALAELMAWNGLDTSSIIKPDQKLELKVTLPPTATNTPGPPTQTPTPTRTGTATSTARPTRTEIAPTATPVPVTQDNRIVPVGLAVVGLISGGLFLFGVLARKKPK